MNKVALVTGGSKSIGYAIGREIVKRIPSATCFMTSRENVSDYYSVILGLELGAGVRHRARFLQMDIRDEEEVSRHRDLIVEQHGGLDILVNNDQVYLRPEVEQFPAQCRQVLATNYWGTKNVIRAFLPDLRADSRIVNITSNLAHVKSVISEQEMERKENARERFSRVESIAELDEVVSRFQSDADTGVWRAEGWPTCAYSISKMAINAHTRLLQTELDEAGRGDVVVNAVYPGTHHSDRSHVKKTQDEDGARFVFYMATLTAGETSGVFPRGSVVWDNSKTVLCDESLPHHNHANHQLQTARQ